MPVSGGAVLGMAAATGELQLYTLSESQVRSVASEESYTLIFWFKDAFATAMMSPDVPFSCESRTSF